MSYPPDGGQDRSDSARASTAQGILPCENDQAKPDRFLTTGTFNLIVKDPYSSSPERGRLDRGPDRKVRVSSNLLRLLILRLTAPTSIFARTFQDYRT